MAVILEKCTSRFTKLDQRQFFTQFTWRINIAKRFVCKPKHSQKVQEDQRSLSLHAAQANQQYHGSQPNPGDPRALQYPIESRQRWLSHEIQSISGKYCRWFRLDVGFSVGYLWFPVKCKNKLTGFPSSPGSPFSPCRPGGPRSPASPGLPEGPASPRTPFGPSLPAGPGGPTGPGLPFEKTEFHWVRAKIHILYKQKETNFFVQFIIDKIPTLGPGSPTLPAAPGKPVVPCQGERDQ